MVLVTLQQQSAYAITDAEACAVYMGYCEKLAAAGEKIRSFAQTFARPSSAERREKGIAMTEGIEQAQKDSTVYSQKVDGAHLLVPTSCVDRCRALIESVERKYPVPPEFGGP